MQIHTYKHIYTHAHTHTGRTRGWRSMQKRTSMPCDTSHGSNHNLKMLLCPRYVCVCKCVRICVCMYVRTCHATRHVAKSQPQDAIVPEVCMCMYEAKLMCIHICVLMYVLSCHVSHQVAPISTSGCFCTRVFLPECTNYSHNDCLFFIKKKIYWYPTLWKNIETVHFKHEIKR